MLVVALAALCTLSGDTPEETFQQLVQAVRERDWDAIYDLSAPSEHAEMSRQIDRMRKDAAGLARLVKLLGTDEAAVRRMDTRKVLITLMARMAEANQEAFERDLGKLRDAKVTGKDEDAEACTLRIHAAGRADEIDLVKEGGHWYFSTMTRAARTANERLGRTSLRRIAAAELRFRINDPDGDGVKNYWVRDVAGLHGLEHDGKPIALIDSTIAAADRSPHRAAYKAVGDGKPVAGYVFRVLDKYVQDGKEHDYDDSSGRNPARFAFAAVPAEYGRLGRLTFLVDQGQRVWKKDTRGSVPKVFPEDPAREGWTPAE